MLTRKERDANYYRANRERLLAKANARALTPEQRERKNSQQRRAYAAAGEPARTVKRAARQARVTPEIRRLDEQQRDPVKRCAKQLVRNALRRGDLKRQPCEICGALQVQAHHDNYDEPLNVRWLCSVHHGEQHRKDSNGRTTA